MASSRKPKKCRKCKGVLNRIGECNLCIMFGQGAAPNGQLPANWPLYSEALAVPVEDAQKYVDDARAKGIPTEFKIHEDGTCAMPVHPDRAHRKAYHKAYGYHDRAGGYGDA